MSTSSPAKQANPLISRPIPGLIRRIGIPVSIGAFFNTMFNVVDTYYGGLISTEALAALGLSFPIFFIIIALSYGLSSGNTALMGNALGKGNRAEAEQFAIQGIVFGAALAILVTILGLAISPPLFRLLGASDDYLAISLQYMNPIFWGTIFFVIVQMLNSILNALGNTKPNRNFLIGGFILNLLLDPWFIFGGFGLPAMGITGIALATVFVQFLGCLYLGVEVAKTRMITVNSLRDQLVPHPKTIYQIAQQGFPNIVDMSSISLGFFAVTYFVSGFGQEAVAAFSVASRVEQVAMLPLIGVDVATLSLTAQNFGARLMERVRIILNTSIKYGLILMAVNTMLLIVFAPQLIAIFSQDTAIIEIGTTYLWIRAWILFPSAIYFVSSAIMRGLKKPLYALSFSMLRLVVIPTIALYILITLLGFGLVSVWWVTLLAPAVISVVGYWYVKRLLNTVAV